MYEFHDWERSFQDAALDPSQWATVLQELADQTASARAQLVGFGNQGVTFNFVTHAARKMLDEFDGIEGSRPDVNFRIAAEQMNGAHAILFEADYERAMPALRDNIYLDYCAQYEIPYGCQSVLLQEPGQMVGFALLRTERDGKTTEDQRQIFSIAERAARTGVRMQLALEKQGMSLLGGMLGDMSVNCILVDRAGRVGTMTGGAERHVADPAGVLRIHGGRIYGLTQKATREIDLALKAMLGETGIGHRRLLLASAETDDRADVARPFRVDFFRLQRREWAIGFIPAVAVIIRDHGARCGTDADAQMLQFAFGLTSAEASVALLLAGGVTREQITVIRGVSNETVRVQVRNIYAKTGCSREAELVLLLADLLG